MTDRSNRHEIIALVKEAQAQGSRFEPACAELNISARTCQRWTLGGEIHEDQRPLAIHPEPANKLSEREKQKVLEKVNQPEYADMAPSQIVPMMADKGEYIASESTIYRILREMNQLKHRSRSKPSVKRIATTHIAAAPNKVWSWDITWLPGAALGMHFKLYLVLDIFSRKIVGWEVWNEEKGEYAAILIEKAVLSEKTYGTPLVLHSDNGSPMKSATLLVTLERLGVAASYSRPRVSNDNPYSESAFKTLKYRPGYPYKGFTNIDEAREWVMKFVDWYNNHHHHSGIKFVTPNERHSGKAAGILANRVKVYAAARQRNPKRWTRGMRNWNLPQLVALNPTEEVKRQLKQAG